MELKQSVTITDIARILNVSVVTVSKALRDQSDISRETKRLVRETAERIGYTPNFMARTLSSRKSNTIGLVVPKVAHFFFSSLIEVIYDMAFQNNFDIALTVSQENPERERRNVETLLAMGVDGMIVSVTQETKDDAIFRKVLRRGVPLVFVDRVLDMDGASTVTVNDKRGAYLGVERAILGGYTRIAHLGGPKEINIGMDRFVGYSDAMKRYGIPLNRDWLIFGGFGEVDGYDGASRLLQARVKPEFIFAVTYPVALGACSALQDAGLKVPDDIDMVCFGTRSVNPLIKPELSYINQRTDLLGEHSVRLVLEHLTEDGAYVPKRVEIPTDFVFRRTCVNKAEIQRTTS